MASKKDRFFRAFWGIKTGCFGGLSTALNRRDIYYKRQKRQKLALNV